MAFVPADLDIVDEALRRLAAGKRITELRFSDRSVRYESASMSDLMTLRATIQSEIAHLSGRSRQVRLFHRGKGI